jgi:hypothetical protein
MTPLDSTESTTPFVTPCSELANNLIDIRFGGRLDDRALEGDLWKLRSVQEDG